MPGLGEWIGATVDLTHPLSAALPHHPAVDPPRVTGVAGFDRDGCRAGRWDLDEHSGTHVDAPAHFTDSGLSVDAIPAGDLVLLAAVLDIRARADADAHVRVEDVLTWEQCHGPLPEACAVLALTGWSERIGDRRRYLGLDATGDPHWPGFAPELARFLVAHRPQVRALGIDTPSLDSAAGERAGSAVHRCWLRDRRYGVENLTNLHLLAPAGAIVVVGVPALVDGSGAPARVLGLNPVRHITAVDGGRPA
ncbi:cyclase family protein [Dactylosporangium sp. NPDC051541]|uniref:cyclase family protein n=1 Tax=Dactylosporangium sp. NPDC051541 TaxID=3363977 RepID=UPI0037B84EF8